MKLLKLILCGLLPMVGCGGQSTNTQQLEKNELANTVNLQKLAGTPFEGYEIGDEIDFMIFFQDEKLTTSVNELPMPVFLVFFTFDEEKEILKGIEIANEAIGYDAFMVTDEWSHDMRIIYKVSHIDHSLTTQGQTSGRLCSFDSKKLFSADQKTDWVIRLVDGVSELKYLTIHELGHAFGITLHARINYERDGLDVLEQDSIMEQSINRLGPPTFNDYNYMMFNQGVILMEHLGYNPAADGKSCFVH